jgi:hypothetical protein
MSLEDFADAFFGKNERGVSTAYGTVLSVNADGSYQVKMSATGDTRCAKLCDAEVGDTVMVLIQANGHCAALGRVGGSPQPDVLYYEEYGTTGTVTLSQSAANYDHMRIFFRKVNGQNQRGSADVFSPDGQYVNMTVFEPYHGQSATWFASKTAHIQGAAISVYDYSSGRINSSPTSGSGDEIAIYRVEAW